MLRQIAVVVAASAMDLMATEPRLPKFVIPDQNQFAEQLRESFRRGQRVPGLPQAFVFSKPSTKLDRACSIPLLRVPLKQSRIRQIPAEPMDPMPNYMPAPPCAEANR